jgi:hypothetical protein
MDHCSFDICSVSPVQLIKIRCRVWFFQSQRLTPFTRKKLVTLTEPPREVLVGFGTQVIGSTVTRDVYKLWVWPRKLALHSITLSLVLYIFRQPPYVLLVQSCTRMDHHQWNFPLKMISTRAVWLWLHSTGLNILADTAGRQTDSFSQPPWTHMQVTASKGKELEWNVADRRGCTGSQLSRTTLKKEHTSNHSLFVLQPHGPITPVS